MRGRSCRVLVSQQMAHVPSFIARSFAWAKSTLITHCACVVCNSLCVASLIPYNTTKEITPMKHEDSMVVTSIGVVAVGAYLSLQRFLRYRRREEHTEIYAKLLTKTSETEKHQKLELARQIQQGIGNVEFPFTYRKSLEFALFRTYAIPSISSLLAKTGIFESNCAVRYDDTDLLICEMLEQSMDSSRSQHALERTNAIHNQYKDQITNDDMLYVLSVFIYEPIRWIEKLEWRSLTNEEQEALYIIWTHLGERMGIRKIPPTLQAFDQWNQDYEEKHMHFAKSNTVIGNATMDLFLSLVPTFTHSTGKEISYCLMDERLRAAMGYPKEISAFWNGTLDLLFALRKWTLQFLCLPRPHWLSARRSPPAVASTKTDSGLSFPNFHVYKRIYAKGYKIGHLGAAPKDKVMKECPFWKD